MFPFLVTLNTVVSSAGTDQNYHGRVRLTMCVYYQPLLVTSHEFPPPNWAEKFKKLIFIDKVKQIVYIEVSNGVSLCFDLIFVRGTLNSANSSSLNFRKYIYPCGLHY